MRSGEAASRTLGCSDPVLGKARLQLVETQAHVNAEIGMERLMQAVAAAPEDRVLTREELAAVVAEVTGSAKLGEKLSDSWGATG